MKRVVAVGESGQRIGQDHPAAKLSDADVELLLGLRGEGWSYRRLADKFEVSKSQARNICKGRKRCVLAVRWKVVEQPVHLPTWE